MCSKIVSKGNLVKALSHAQLRQTNLENQIHIATDSPKKGLNDTVFQHFVVELMHCNSDMQMDLSYKFQCFCACIQYIWLVYL